MYRDKAVTPPSARREFSGREPLKRIGANYSAAAPNSGQKRRPIANTTPSRPSAQLTKQPHSKRNPRVALDTLPIEILEKILQLCETHPSDTSRRPFLSLCLTCRQLQKAATPFLYQNLEFRPGGLAVLTFIQRIRKKPQHARFVQHLAIHGSRTELLRPLSSFLHVCVNMKTLCLNIKELPATIDAIPNRTDLFPNLVTCTLSADAGDLSHEWHVREVAVRSLLRFWAAPKLERFHLHTIKLCLGGAGSKTPTNLPAISHFGLTKCLVDLEALEVLSRVRRTSTLVLWQTTFYTRPTVSMAKIPRSIFRSPSLTDMKFVWIHAMKPFIRTMDNGYPDLRRLTLTTLQIDIKNIAKFSRLSDRSELVARLPFTLKKLAIELRTWLVDVEDLPQPLLQLLKRRKRDFPHLQQLELRIFRGGRSDGPSGYSPVPRRVSDKERKLADAGTLDRASILLSSEYAPLWEACQRAGISFTGWSAPARHPIARHCASFRDPTEPWIFYDSF